MDSDAKALFERFIDKINSSLEKLVPRKYTSTSLHKVVGETRFDLDTTAINKAINDPVWDLLDRGGKRWRPVLFLKIVDLLGKNPEDFIGLSSVFELIHNATLIVDDIEDSSVKRRGKACVHLIYGVDIAINAGNSIYFLPLQILDELKGKLTEEVILKIYRTYVEEMINLSFGQATDIAWHRGLVDGFSITESQYLQMCAFKTGCLARMACKVAATVSGADDDLVAAIGLLGESLGVVFQIQDDILNITKSELSDKKGFGDDITEGKRSLPVIYALSTLSKSSAKRLIKILLLHTHDQSLIEEAVGLINQAEGIEKAQKTMKEIFEDAWRKLDPLIQDSSKKDQLYNLAKFLIDRQI